MSGHYETSTRQRQQRYSSYGDESIGSTQIRSSGSVSSNETRSVNYLANNLKTTASFDYNRSRNSYYNEKENENDVEHEYEKPSSSHNIHNTHSEDYDRTSLENNYSRAMNQMNRGDYGPIRQKNKKLSQGSENSNSNRKSNEREKICLHDDAVPSHRSRNGMSTDRRVSQSTLTTQVSTTSTTQAIPIEVKKRSVSKKDPSEETIAIFGAYGITGQYFLQRAIETGYNIQALILPGMEMEDVACSKSLRLITGSLNEVEKIREVVENATYVVCLMNDFDHEHFMPPIGNTEDSAPIYDNNNLNFMHNLVPILEDSDACRVLLYEASSLSKGNRGTPILSTVVKKMALRKEWRNKKREQDLIVKYVMAQTKNAHFNYVITRPSGSIWDKPSRKKLAASKSQPGPFPITNIDLAQFTLNALKMEKVYNSCPFVVQDGI